MDETGKTITSSVKITIKNLKLILIVHLLENVKVFCKIMLSFFSHHPVT